MTAALLADPRFVDALNQTAETAPAEVIPADTAPRRGIFGLNDRIGAWVKAHPRLAVLLLIAL